MTEQYEIDIINQRLESLSLIISNLEEGIASLEWVKEENDERTKELTEFISQRDALIEKRNTLEQVQNKVKQDTIQRYKDAKWT